MATYGYNPGWTEGSQRLPQEPRSLEGALAAVPGMAQFLAMQQYIRNRERQKLADQEQDQFRQERGALPQGATPEQRISLGTRYSGPPQIVTSAENEMARREATQARTAAAQMAAEARDAATAANQPEQVRLINFMNSLPEGHPARIPIQARIDSLGAADKNIEIREAFPVSETHQQPHQRNRVSGAWEPVPGTKPRPIFSPKETTEKDREKKLNQLGIAFERAGLSQVDAAIRAAENAVSETPEVKEYLTGIKSKYPDAMVSDKIANARQDFRKLFNIELKNRSGGAVTNQEFDRLKAEFASGLWNTPVQIENGLKKARNIIIAHYRGIAATYGPEALADYNKNLEELGGTPVLSEAHKTSVTAKPSGGWSEDKEKRYQELLRKRGGS